MLRAAILWAALGAATATVEAAEPFEFPSREAVGKAGDLLGARVETRDGEDLGRVSDFAVDLERGRIAYVVVSVGSFLIEDSLIAVAPAALQPAPGDSDRLVLRAGTQALRAARRFSADDWPLAADVTAPPRERADTPDDDPQEESAERGRATISDGRKTATLSAGERRIEQIEPEEDDPAPEPAPDAGADAEPDDKARRRPDTRFARLDRDGDGVLDRAEIAHELSRDDRFAEIDDNGNGVIEAAEFDAWQDDDGSA